MSQRTEAELGEALYGTPATPAPTEAPQADSAPRPRTEAELGEALYGKPAAAPVLQPPAEEPPQQRTAEELAAAMYPKDAEPVQLDPVPAEVQELRDDIARRMYSAQDTLREAVPEAPEETFTTEGIDPAVGRKALAEVREMFADLDLGPREVQDLRQRAERLRDAPVDPIAQREAAVEALNREFGQGAKQAWRDARALVARDPRVGKLIEAMGLGDDPDTVLLLARTARSQRIAGKLKGR